MVGAVVVTAVVVGAASSSSPGRSAKKRLTSRPSEAAISATLRKSGFMPRGYWSFSRTSSLTARAFALPPVSFITWPTKKPSRPSLPPL